MNKLLLVFCLLFSTLAPAESENTLIGAYRHKYAAPDQAVLSLVDRSGVWTMEREEEGKIVSYPARILDASQVSAFWSRMHWPVSTAKNATCATFDNATLCHVPPQDRKAISWISKADSDYFRHDSMGGVMTFYKLPISSKLKR